MSIKLISAAVLAATLSTAAFAGDMAFKVTDSYARSASANAKTGAAFITLKNMTDTDDRLIGVASPAAKRVELHTHMENDGVMKMTHVEEGFPVMAGEMIEMQRGGKHVMMMGLNGPFEQGATVPVTLTFERAGEMEVMVPVDLERQPKEGHGMKHGKGHDEGHGEGHGNGHGAKHGSASDS
ncbi:copper chaperone PCu(A)C [Litoreibacter albidus]|uniref:Copper(I)-binding protein n=1 Tax=Litoreibacter albidus TaxID=670155 RepID=A0A1H2RFW0_9RHOB|nr:copper chaperone PCu(A)C [Litoreibacter albidus]SDW18277.1 hypothetical protein SAMN04488001_0490 [Litoreibacter albidus]